MQAGETILIVDDDPGAHTILCAMLAPEGYRIESAYDGRAARERLRAAPYDLVLTDIRMPGMDGVTLLDDIRAVRPETRVVVMTAESTPAAVVRAIRNNAYSFLAKPISRTSLLETVNSAIHASVSPDDIVVASARPGWISIDLRCKLAIADRLAQFFRELATELSQEERDSVSTAFRELLMNAIEHGGQSDPAQKVRFTYIRTARSIIYYIRDPGPGFSFDNLPHAAISNTPDRPFGHAEVRSELGIRPGGFGILLTKNFADELVYSEKGNEVVLIKYLPGANGAR